MLSLEEHLLETPHQNTLLINYGTPPAIILGKSNNRNDLVVENPKIPLIRRFSGGGTVIVDESTLFITWILSKNLPQARCTDTLFNWTISLLQSAHPHLPLNRLETDYVLGKQKIGGTAQYVKKDRILHHTSFLFDYSTEKMALLKNPTKAPAYRQNRPHTDFITKLSGPFTTPQDFVAPLLIEVEKEFIVEKRVFPATFPAPKQTVYID